MRSLWLACLLAASPAGSAERLDRTIIAGLEFIRDAPDGGAMFDYIRADPVPIAFAPLTPDRSGHYVSKTYFTDGRVVDRARIELNADLRGASRERVGRVLYHEYIHRLQDQSPQDMPSADAHSPAGYALAMRYLRDQVRPGQAVPEAPREVRDGFRESGKHAPGLARRRVPRRVFSAGRSSSAD
jgi:hypothetical protein